MERSKLIEDITTYLATFVTKVKAEGLLNLHNSNIDAEYFLCEFLNKLYGLQLVNANDEFQNEGGIDLVDHDNHIVIQVTSTATTTKISNSFKKADKKKYKNYRFRFFFIEEPSAIASLRNSKAKGLEPASFVFEKESDILDYKTLVNELGSKPIEILQELEAIARKHIMPVFTYNGNQVVINVNNGFVEISKDSAQSIGQHLNDYIERFRGKYSEIKTLLHQDKVPFYDVYYPLSIKRKNGQKIRIERNIRSVFLNEKQILISGTAGAGKTMLMKHCFLSAMNSSLIPIMIVFREMEDNESIVSYVKDKIFGFDPTCSDTLFHKMLSSGQFLFILDGFDEVPAKDINTRFNEINSFVDCCPFNCFFLTTRPGTEAPKLDRFHMFKICDLEDDDIVKFAKKQCDSIDDMFSTDKIINALESDRTYKFREYFTNPLLLSMFIMTYSRHPELPEKKSDYYRNVIDQLLYKHDSSKGAYRHERNSGIETDSQFIEILKRLSYDSYFDEKVILKKGELVDYLVRICEELDYDCSIDGLIYDLTTSLCILVEDDGTYSFPHRSIQEYFVALLVKEQDPEDKKYFYQEGMFGQGQDNREIYGLWSLLEEMDTKAFKELFVIPLLGTFFESLPDDTNPVNTFNTIIDKLQILDFPINDKFSYWGCMFKTPENSYRYICFFEYLRRDPIKMIYKILKFSSDKYFLREKKENYYYRKLLPYELGTDMQIDRSLEEMMDRLRSHRNYLVSSIEYVEKENKSASTRFGKRRNRFGR